MTDKAKLTGRAARPTDAASVAAREELTSWTKAFSDQVVDNVLHYRNRRKLRNEELRERLRELGWVLTENSLAGILGKKRASMPITDVLLFAWALNVPPIALLFPLHTNGPVSTSPKESERPVQYRDHAYSAARWFMGNDGDAHSGATFHSDFDTSDSYFQDAGDLMTRLEEIDESMFKLAAINAPLADAATEPDLRARLQEEARDHMSTIAMGRRYLRSVHPDLRLPRLHGALSTLDDARPAYPMLPLRELDTPPLASNPRLEFADSNG